MEEINFKEMGLDRYEVLCALYNKSKPLGLGMLHFIPGPLALEGLTGLPKRGLKIQQHFGWT